MPERRQPAEEKKRPQSPENSGEKQQDREPKAPGGRRKMQAPGEKQQQALPKSAPDRPEFVVGVGASAGGLEALEALFGAMPRQTGMAFVVVLHLKADQKAMTAELLGRNTELAVKEAADGERVRADHVYVIPPGSDLQIYNGELQLLERRDDGMRTPIDTFFHSLAEDQQERAVCIVLSGMGSDGSQGLREIKSGLGMAMAQEPAGAKSRGMPDRAIQTGLVDYVLAPAEMPRQLLDYAEAWRRGRKDRGRQEPPTGEKRRLLQKIFMLLRSETGHDFSGYKPTTVLRRIDRRQKVHRIGSLEEYIKFLHRNKHELRTLFKEMLIGVTSFFRDPEAFETLRQALERQLGSKPDGYEVRAWVVGCATGEEAYSVAILVREILAKLDRDLEVQIFATDIDPEAIARARYGLYPSGITKDVNGERLERFFTREDDDYRVSKEIREMVVFAEQNAVKDPPFTKLDLVCCRNLLIYLEPEIQQKLLPLFHYSLRPDGLLFLGSAESVGQFHDRFETVDKKWKLYRRQETEGAHREVRFPAALEVREERRKEPGMKRPHEEPGQAEQVRQALLSLYAPAAVLITRQGEIQYIHGRTGKYLEPPAGRANWNIMEMAREGLKLDLTTAIRQAASKEEEVRRERVRVRTNGGYQNVSLRVAPLDRAEEQAGRLLVTFEDVPEPEPQAEQPGGELHAPSEAAEKIRALEAELQRTKENLQTAVEELESSNEELKSTNEEYQSTNEELQSTNEELESSREELQSLNEELVTVNAELQGKVEEADRAYEEMKNFLDSLEIPTLFLDREMRVQRFSSQANRIFRLIDSDLGRPISDLVSHLEEDDLVVRAHRVLHSLRGERQEVRTREGDWFLMRVMPYRNPDNVIEGVVVVFLEITDLKQTQEKLFESRYARAMVDTVREPLLVLDGQFRVQAANAAFSRTFKLEPEAVVGSSLFELGSGQWDIPRLRDLLERILPEYTTFEEFLVEHEFPGIGRRRMLLNARRIKREQEEDQILLAMEDVTERGG